MQLHFCFYKNFADLNLSQDRDVETIIYLKLKYNLNQQNDE